MSFVKRSPKAPLAAGALAALLTAATVPSLSRASSAVDTAATHSGRVSILVTAHGAGKSYDLVTGAITDYGIDRDAGHNAQKIILSKGTFELGAAQFNKNFKVRVDKATCAATGTSHASNMPISHGTGAYAGINGRLTLKAIFVELAKKLPDGRCDLSARPISASDVLTGTGTVSY